MHFLPTPCLPHTHLSRLIPVDHHNTRNIWRRVPIFKALILWTGTIVERVRDQAIFKIDECLLQKIDCCVPALDRISSWSTICRHISDTLILYFTLMVLISLHEKEDSCISPISPSEICQRGSLPCYCVALGNMADIACDSASQLFYTEQNTLM
jgi:hypothetical protein